MKTDFEIEIKLASHYAAQKIIQQLVNERYPFSSKRAKHRITVKMMKEYGYEGFLINKDNNLISLHDYTLKDEDGGWFRAKIFSRKEVESYVRFIESCDYFNPTVFYYPEDPCPECGGYVSHNSYGDYYLRCVQCCTELSTQAVMISELTDTLVPSWYSFSRGPGYAFADDAWSKVRNNIITVSQSGGLDI